MSICKICGGPTIPLFTGFACKNECDLKKTTSPKKKYYTQRLGTVLGTLNPGDIVTPEKMKKVNSNHGLLFFHDDFNYVSESCDKVLEIEPLGDVLEQNFDSFYYPYFCKEGFKVKDVI